MIASANLTVLTGQSRQDSAQWIERNPGL